MVFGCKLLHIFPTLLSLSSISMAHASTQQHQNHSSFFNFAERKVYKLNNVLKGFDHGAWCAGSSHGWLIILDQKGNSFIFNPFSTVTIQLPSIKSLHEQDREDEDYGELLTSEEIHVAKAILMSDPSSTKSFTIVIIYGFLESLALYTHGENSTTWTWFGDYRRYDDILCHNDKLYVLPHKCGCKVVLEVWNFDNNFPKKVTRIEPPVDEDEIGFKFGEVDGLYCQAYLMESVGEILCVKRLTCLIYDEDFMMKKIRHHFDVYKLDWCGKRLENAVTLGDEAIFLGRNQSVTVSTRKFREW